MHVCSYLREGWSSNSSVSFNCTFTWFCWSSLSLNLVLIHATRWSGHGAPGSSCLYLLSIGITGMCCCDRLYVVPRDWTQVLRFGDDGAWAFKWWAVCCTYTAMAVMSLNGEYSKSVRVYVAQHHVCSLLLTCDVPLGSTWVPCPRSRYRESTSVTGPKKLGMRVWRISIWLSISQGDQHKWTVSSKWTVVPALLDVNRALICSKNVLDYDMMV